jgi:hypothetical protein
VSRSRSPISTREPWARPVIDHDLLAVPRAQRVRRVASSMCRAPLPASLLHFRLTRRDPGGQLMMRGGRSRFCRSLRRPSRCRRRGDGGCRCGRSPWNARVEIDHPVMGVESQHRLDEEERAPRLPMPDGCTSAPTRALMRQQYRDLSACASLPRSDSGRPKAGRQNPVRAPRTSDLQVGR